MISRKYIKAISFLAAIAQLPWGLPVYGVEFPSYSDISVDSMDSDKKGSQERDPFNPGTSEDSIDPQMLNVEGILIGPSIKLTLISGKILKEGSPLGVSLVKEIAPTHVMLQTASGMVKLPMTGHFISNSTPGQLYDIVFNNALVANALRLLAAAGSFNLIMPETLTGRVSVNFSQIEIKDALRSILRVNGMEFAEENSVVRVGKPEDFAGGAYYDTRHINLRYASAKDLVDTVKSHLSDKGTVSADIRTNTLIIKDSQSVLNNVESVVANLDKKDTQVRIEAKIVDVTKNFSRSLGIQWGLTRNTGRVQGFGAVDVGSINGQADPLNINLPAANPAGGVGILVGNVINNTDLSAQLTSAEARGDAHIISQPSITTVNNTAAKIRSGVKIYVKSTSDISVGGSGGSASSSQSGLEEIDTGIELTVTPQISTDQTIKLKIEAQESEADYTRTVDGIPAVIDNTADTTVLVTNGETTVIGGLLKVNKSNSTNGMPFLSRVPMLGWLFKSNTRNKTDNELLIFITPYIGGKPTSNIPPSHLSRDDTTSIPPQTDGNKKKKGTTKYSR